MKRWSEKDEILSNFWDLSTMSVWVDILVEFANETILGSDIFRLTSISLSTRLPVDVIEHSLSFASKVDNSTCEEIVDVILLSTLEEDRHTRFSF